MNKIIESSLEIGSVSIRVTGSEGVGVKDVVFSSSGVGNFELGDYFVGDDFYTNPKLVSYALSLFLTFIKEEQITVSVKGSTNADTNGDFGISLRFEDVEIKAKVL